MTAFLIICMILFLISIISNTAYILNNYTDHKLGSVIGLVIFTGMFVWALSILI